MKYLLNIIFLVLGPVQSWREHGPHKTILTITPDASLEFPKTTLRLENSLEVVTEFAESCCIVYCSKRIQIKIRQEKRA